MVAYTFNLSIQEAEVGDLCEFRSAWAIARVSGMTARPAQKKPVLKSQNKIEQNKNNPRIPGREEGGV